MRALIAIAIILSAVAARAQICPDTPPGYIRQYRPAGVDANYPPPSEPACYQIGTQTSALPFCGMCHFQPSPSPTVATVLTAYCSGCHPHRG